VHSEGPEWVISLDFNDMRAGLLPALRSELRGVGKLEKGLWVVASDAEGNRCRARIDRIKNDVIYLRPDLETWITLPDVELRSTFYWFPAGWNTGETRDAWRVTEGALSL
jgi:hypothetical protein